VYVFYIYAYIHIYAYICMLVCYYGKNLARHKLRKFQILIVVCMKCENRSGVL
jgi:hypothetical protein